LRALEAVGGESEVCVIFAEIVDNTLSTGANPEIGSLRK